ncbi:MAG: glycosyltransferase family 4 protein [Pseudomonadota bacterium]|nr:glycosyltransferase family 4 protein [Pseudomonadota bacterium]
MKILYLSSSSIPSEMANAVHVMHMCDAFKELGHNVTLFCYNGIKEDPFTYYNTKNNFYIEQMRTSPFLPSNKILDTARIYLKYKMRNDFDLFYGRNLLALWALRNNGTPIVYESHSTPPSKIHLKLESDIFRSSNFKHLTVITEQLKNKYLDTFECISPHNIVVAHDAATPPSIAPKHSHKQNKRLRVGYVGTLSRGKGAAVVCRLAASCPQHEFHLVGKLEPDCKQMLESATSNVYLYGHLPHKELSHLYPTFDVVLLPNQARIQVGNRDIGAWNSPMKLFEYMSHRLAIISSDFPNIREILSHRKNAILVRHDSIEDWISSLNELEKNEELRKNIGQSAYKTLIENHTWKIRAKIALQ